MRNNIILFLMDSTCSYHGSRVGMKTLILGSLFQLNPGTQVDFSAPFFFFFLLEPLKEYFPQY